MAYVPSALATTGRLYLATSPRIISFHLNTPPAAQYLIEFSWSLVRLFCSALISKRSATYKGDVVATGAATVNLSGLDNRTGFQVPAFKSNLEDCSAGKLDVRLLTSFW